MISSEDLPQIEKAMTILKLRAPLTSMECLRLTQYLMYDGQQDLGYRLDMLETREINIILIREA